MQVELSPKELRVLLELLEEHRYFGWIYQAGEFGVGGSGEVSPTLEALLGRIRKLKGQADGLRLNPPARAA